MSGIASYSRRKRVKGISVRSLFRRGRAEQCLDERRERLVSESELDQLLTIR